MNIVDFKSFLAVVEYHSISLAAKKMHISQPALSKRIKKMELEWNIQLFVSSGLRTELTPKGMQLLPYVRQMIYLNEEIRNHAVNKDTPSQLLINVGTSVYVAKTIVPPFMMHLNSLEFYYFMNTKLVAERSVAKNLINGTCDIIISPTIYHNANIAAVPLWTEKIKAFVGVSHPLAHTKKECSITDLATYDSVLMDRDFLIRRILDKLIDHENISLKIVAETNTIYNALALVEAGLGWSLLYERLLNPRLVSLKLSEVLPNIEFHCYFLKRRMDERLISNFVNQLRNWASTSLMFKN